MNVMKRSQAEVIREFLPVDEDTIHGVTFDGTHVWFARDHEVVAFDPATSRIVRRHALPSARGGTAFDGQHLFQIGAGRIFVVDPQTGEVVRSLPAPGKGEDTGMAWADGYLWIGEWGGKRIHKVDAQTGEVVKSLVSDRFVTGVSCVAGALWHGAMGDDQPPEIRRLGSDGSVAESVSVPSSRVGGLEGTASGDFWFAGERGRLGLLKI